MTFWLGDPVDALRDEFAELTIGTGQLAALDRDSFYRQHLSTSPAHGLPAETGLAWHWAPAAATSPCQMGHSSRLRSPVPHSAVLSSPPSE